MHALLFCLLASVCAATANFFFRRNTSQTSTTNTPANANGYLFSYYTIAFLLSLILFPKIWSTPINYIVVSIGATVGLLNIAMMHAVSYALKKGPAGLSFAILNISSVFPGVLLYLFFGSTFGFAFTYLQVLGITLVVGGIFWTAKKISEGASSKLSKRWLALMLGAFAIQILALFLMQWRCLLFECENKPEHLLIPATFAQSDDIWFMPSQFAISMIVQGIIFLTGQRSNLKKEALNGSLGGLANAFATCLLLLATKVASPVESGILFPAFAAGTIVLCNIWANRIYKEVFSIPANLSFALGIFLSSL